MIWELWVICLWQNTVQEESHVMSTVKRKKKEIPFRNVKTAWSRSLLHPRLYLITRYQWHHSFKIMRHSPRTTGYPLDSILEEIRNNSLLCTSGKMPPCGLKVSLRTLTLESETSSRDCTWLSAKIRHTGGWPWGGGLRTIVKNLEYEPFVKTFSIIIYNFCYTNYKYLPSCLWQLTCQQDLRRSLEKVKLRSLLLVQRHPQTHLREKGELPMVLLPSMKAQASSLKSEMSTGRKKPCGRN